MVAFLPLALVAFLAAAIHPAQSIDSKHLRKLFEVERSFDDIEIHGEAEQALFEMLYDHYGDGEVPPLNLVQVEATTARKKKKSRSNNNSSGPPRSKPLLVGANDPSPSGTSASSSASTDDTAPVSQAQSQQDPDDNSATTANDNESAPSQGSSGEAEPLEIEEQSASSGDGDDTSSGPQQCTHYNMCMNLKKYIGVGSQKGTQPDITPEVYCEKSKNKFPCTQQCVESATVTLDAIRHPCRADRKVLGKDEWWTLCASDEHIRPLMGSKSPIGWSKGATVGWDDKEVVTYAWEKESRSPAVLNIYRPEFLSKELWLSLCPKDRFPCIHPLCPRGKKPCVPSADDAAESVKKESDNAMIQVFNCIQRTTPEKAFTCIRAVRTKNLLSADQQTQILEALSKHYMRKVADYCIWTRDAKGFGRACDVKRVQAKDRNQLSFDTCECVKDHLGNVVGEFLDDKYIKPNGEKGPEAVFNDELVQMLVEEASNKATGARANEEFFPVVSFIDYVKFEPNMFNYMGERLQQEIATTVWEVAHRKCESTLGAAFGEVAIMQSLFANSNNLHFHIVFPRPKSRCCDCDQTDWTKNNRENCNAIYQCGGCQNPFGGGGGGGGGRGNKKKNKNKGRSNPTPEEKSAYQQRRGYAAINRHLAALATQINDYGALNSYHTNAKTKYLAVWDSDDHKQLESALVTGERRLRNLEAMTDGHNWGTFKQAFIALRTNVYGPDRIGWEIRGGINKRMEDTALSQMARNNVTDALVAYEPVLFVENLLNILHDLKPNADEVPQEPIKISVQNDLYSNVTDDVNNAVEQVSNRSNYTLGELYDFVRDERTVGYEYWGALKKDDPDVCFDGCTSVGGVLMPNPLLHFTLRVAAHDGLKAFQCEKWHNAYAKRVWDLGLRLEAFQPERIKSARLCACRDRHGESQGSDTKDKDPGCDEHCPSDLEHGEGFVTCAQDVWKRWSFLFLNLKSWEHFLTDTSSATSQEGSEGSAGDGSSGDGSSGDGSSGDGSSGDDEGASGNGILKFQHMTVHNILQILTKEKFQQCATPENAEQVGDIIKGGCEHEIMKLMYRQHVPQHIREKFHH